MTKEMTQGVADWLPSESELEKKKERLNELKSNGTSYRNRLEILNDEIEAMEKGIEEREQLIENYEQKIENNLQEIAFYTDNINYETALRRYVESLSSEEAVAFVEQTRRVDEFIKFFFKEMNMDKE